MNINKKLLKNEYIKSAIVIVAIIGIILGLFFGLQLALNTSVPVRVVESGSMCVPYSAACDGWSHPFAQSLHIGDIIIIQNVKPEELNTKYPESDIIVYNNPDKPLTATPIVHRIVATQEINGTLYFQTKGDGNSYTRWPNVPSPTEYDYPGLWQSSPNGVPENLVIGRVIMRIPYLGHITLFLNGNEWGKPLIVILIILLIAIEFVLPIIRAKTSKNQTKETNPETQNIT